MKRRTSIGKRIQTMGCYNRIKGEGGAAVPKKKTKQITLTERNCRPNDKWLDKARAAAMDLERRKKLSPISASHSQHSISHCRTMHLFLLLIFFFSLVSFATSLSHASSLDCMA